MKKEDIDYSLYLVTDRGLSRGRPMGDIIAMAVEGGATCVQLREKACSTREFVHLALEMKAVCNRRQVPLIINDRIDVALAVNADGVHLGQSDMPLETARKILGEEMIIGISAESLQDALDAEKGGADYLGVSPVYDTPTKTDTAPALGLSGLREIRRHIAIPLVGIGGIHAGNADGVIESGADGVAVVSAIVAADDPVESARGLAEIVRKAKRSR